MISRCARDKTDRHTSRTAAGPTPIAISLTFVTLVIFGLSRPNILFILIKMLEKQTQVVKQDPQIYKQGK